MNKIDAASFLAHSLKDEAEEKVKFSGHITNITVLAWIQNQVNSDKSLLNLHWGRRFFKFEGRRYD